MSDDITSKEISAAIVANSLQINADDLINLTMDVTIAAVQRGTSEQPIRVVLSETSKFYMPSKTFRRILVACFTDDAKNWIGQRIRLARDPDICWGGIKVGGVIITHASIAAPLILSLALKRGKKQQHKIDVLPAQKAAPKAAKPVAQPVVAPEPKPHARGTISGDASEGNLSMIPMIPKADMDKMLAAFAKIGMDEAAVEKKYSKKLAEWTLADMGIARELFVLLADFNKVGMGKDAVELEYNKPLADWTAEDLAEAREVFKSCKAAFDAKAATTNEDVI